MISSLYVHPGTLNVGIGTSMPLATLDVNGTIRASNISIIGDFVTLNTVTSNTEQMVIQNAGTGPALKVTQTGANSIAEFYDDGNVLALKIADGGNVGIGTATPTQKFHVSGAIKSTMSINSDTQFLGQATDSAATPSFSFIDDTNTGIFKPTLDSLGISCGGNERVRVLSNGNVGIGTIYPQAKLHVAGMIKSDVPSFFVRSDTVQTIASWGNSTKIDYNLTPSFNRFNLYNTTTKRLIPVVNGLYYIYASYSLTKSTENRYQYIAITKNATSIGVSDTFSYEKKIGFGGFACAATSGNIYPSIQATSISELTTSDYVEVYGSGMSDAPKYNAIDDGNIFMAYLITAL